MRQMKVWKSRCTPIMNEAISGTYPFKKSVSRWVLANWRTTQPFQFAARLSPLSEVEPFDLTGLGKSRGGSGLQPMDNALYISLQRS